MALKYSIILSAVDRATAPLKRVQESAKRLSGMGGLGAVPGATGRANAGLARLQHNLKMVNSPMYRVQQRLSGMIARLQRFSTYSNAAAKAAGALTRKMGALALSFAKWGAVGAVGYGIKSIVATASQFEKYQTMLETTEGSQAKAKKAMAWVSDFAAKTPYELDNVMEAFVQLKAYGIDPTAGALNSVGDAASGMNKTLMEGVEALADAQTGEFERLKSFGITTKQMGAKVAFNWSQAGKNMTVTANKNAADIQKALTGIFDGHISPLDM